MLEKIEKKIAIAPVVHDENKKQCNENTKQIPRLI